MFFNTRLLVDFFCLVYFPLQNRKFKEKIARFFLPLSAMVVERKRNVASSSPTKTIDKIVLVHQNLDSFFLVLNASITLKKNNKWPAT